MLLVIDTALAALSLALLDGERVVASHHEVIGRGHAEALMTAVAALVGDGPPPTAIIVDIGPGSFTGLRIGIAAARALGLAWNVPVTGYSSLALIAAPCLAADPALGRLAVVAEAGRGQLYVQVLDREFVAEQDAVALTASEAAVWLDPLLALAGPGAASVRPTSSPRLRGNDGEAETAHVIAETWPDARDAWRLPPAARNLSPTPLYVRPPDAVLPA